MLRRPPQIIFLEHLLASLRIYGFLLCPVLFFVGLCPKSAPTPPPSHIIVFSMFPSHHGINERAGAVMYEVPAIASHGFCVFIDGNSKERPPLFQPYVCCSLNIGISDFRCFFCLFFYMVLSFMHVSHFIPFIIASANICCQDKAC